MKLSTIRLTIPRIQWAINLWFRLLCFMHFIYRIWRSEILSVRFELYFSVWKVFKINGQTSSWVPFNFLSAAKRIINKSKPCSNQDKRTIRWILWFRFFCLLFLQKLEFSCEVIAQVMSTEIKQTAFYIPHKPKFVVAFVHFSASFFWLAITTVNCHLM